MARRAPGSSGGAKVTGRVPSVAQLAESVNITLYFNSCVGTKYSPPGRAKRARPYGSCYRFEPNTSTELKDPFFSIRRADMVFLVGLMRRGALMRPLTEVVEISRHHQPFSPFSLRQKLLIKFNPQQRRCGFGGHSQRLLKLGGSF